MNSLRYRLTWAFGSLLVGILIVVFLVMDRQIQRSYEGQVRQTTRQIQEWLGYVYAQVGRQLEAPLQRVRTDSEVLRAIRAGRRGNRPESELAILEYGDATGRILYSDWRLREGQQSEYRDLEQPTLVLWQNHLAMLQSFPVESGAQRFGFVTGGNLLYQQLQAFAPPGGVRLFLREGNARVLSLGGDPPPPSAQRALISAEEVVLAGAPYRIARLSLGENLGSLIGAIPRAAVDAQRRQLRTLLLVMSLLSIAATYASSYGVARTLTRPLERLSEGARRLASGDLQVQVPVSSQDEIGLLAQQFNQMVQDLRDLQQRLLRAERVAVWRDMARMMAHEIKNPLFPIQLSVENLQRCYRKRPEMLPEVLEESTRTILEEVTKLRRLVDEFREFARLPEPQFQPCQVNEVLRQVGGMYAEMSDAVAWTWELDPDLPGIQADPQQIGQVFQNLIKNALEAMPEGGTLTLRTRGPGRIPTAEMKQLARNRRWIGIQVADTGVGMTEEVLQNLFRPYYTTKEGGTGLGMAIVERIVHAHGGHIEVQSRAGEGTQVSVFLPVEPPHADR